MSALAELLDGPQAVKWVLEQKAAGGHAGSQTMVTLATAGLWAHQASSQARRLALQSRPSRRKLSSTEADEATTSLFFPLWGEHKLASHGDVRNNKQLLQKALDDKFLADMLREVGALDHLSAECPPECFSCQLTDSVC